VGRRILDRPSPAEAGPAPYQGFGYRPAVPSTPNGVPLSGWWKRVAARLLDGLILMIGSLSLTGYFLLKWFSHKSVPIGQI